MTIETNENFVRLLKTIEELGPEASAKASDVPAYQKFLAAFPLNRLKYLTADEYCVGKGGDTFCRWLERGLESALGRYMPGTSRGHIVYFVKKDGTLYKNRLLSELSDEEAVRYTVQIQSAIASADLQEDICWIDSDQEVFKRAGVPPLVTVGHGRKLRLLAAYHPDDVLPISSSAHLGHFLAALGCPPAEIPPEDMPIARMLKLRAYFDLARRQYSELTTRGFVLALYDKALGIAPQKPETDADGSVEATDEAAPAYLLTWNPEHFKLGGDGDVTPGTEHRWTCHSKQPKVGDTVYLVRLGTEPRGIVARGVVTGESFEAPHWKDSSKQARYIRFTVDEFRPSAASGLLPMALLTAAMPDYKWSPQSSGVGVPTGTERVLRGLWEGGADKHSLRQFVDWLVELALPGGAPPREWVDRYKATTALAASLASNPERLDDAALEELWRQPLNGVAHVGAGTLATKEFADNLEFLKTLTGKILQSPTAERLVEAEASWAAAVKAQRFRMLNRAVIRRVFAAASPHHFTTLLRETDCQRALALIKRQFELVPPLSAGSDWASMNADLVACMKLGGLDGSSPVENNVALWMLADTSAPADNVAPPVPAGVDDLHDVAPAPREMATARNLILYGPPGTGKTHKSIEEAIAILAPDLLEGEPNRANIKAKFDELVRTGQVVFTTFHQSFSYEEFVEGIRAETDADGQLHYRVADGIFKTICGYRAERTGPETGVTAAFRSGDEIGGYQVLRCTTDILELRKPKGRDLPIGMSLLLELCNLLRSGQISLDDIRNRRVFEKVPDTKLEPNLVNGYSNILPLIVEKLMSSGSAGIAEDSTRRDDSPRVLIIDEINRGSVARIFGELISLIEPSKRRGMPEALSVTLPYSKTRFSVPRNVHIIGTMNTADRSLVGLDIALRRRFEFRELEPQPDLLDDVPIEGIALGSILRSMNERIEALLDRDHRLGHAYLLALRETPTLSALATIFRTSIIPLLQEYFFEDYERIRWVLNDHRKPSALQFLRHSEVTADRLFGESVTLNTRPSRWVLNEQAFMSPEAYAGIVAVAAA